MKTWCTKQLRGYKQAGFRGLRQKRHISLFLNSSAQCWPKGQLGAGCHGRADTSRPLTHRQPLTQEAAAVEAPGTTLQEAHLPGHSQAEITEGAGA